MMKDEDERAWLYLAGNDTRDLIIEHLDNAPIHPQHLEEPEGAQVDFDKIEGWIAECVDDPDSSCSQHYGRSRKVSGIRLIDVKTRCLVETWSTAQFVALSYVWGSVSQLRLTLSNLPWLSRPGAFGIGEDYHDDLPLVIQDALFLVEKLGQRYLWVDSLCIVQEDCESKRQQIRHMDSIYNGAVFTIVALAASDANDRLPGVRKYTRQRPAERMETEREGARLGLATRTRPLWRLINESKYNSRGWTFQERLLSRRCLFFLQDRVVFQCRDKICSEDAFDYPSSVPANLNPLNELPRWQAHLAEKEWRAAFRFYTNLAIEYTRKDMTKRSDIGNAFAGITTVLESQSGWRMLSGLPDCVLDFALLWAPSGSAQRRRIDARDSQAINYAFPSWSWFGWEGAIDYDQLWMRHSIANGALRSCVGPMRLRSRQGVERLRRGPTEIRGYGADRSASERMARPTRKQAQQFSRAQPFCDVLEFDAHAVLASDFSFTSHPPRHTLPSGFSGKPQPMTQILDIRNRRCGLLYGVDFHKPSKMEFEKLILLSELTDFEADGQTEDDWFGIDRRVFKRSPWCILNVMLLKRNPFGYDERVAIGHMHADAWHDGSEGKVDFIRLA
jgi:Heterokaryon incompatibility protein (HET)